MTKTIVHVTTLEQWKSVLDVWYKQGYSWGFSTTKYEKFLFENGARFLFLDDYITYSNHNYGFKSFIEYSEFMAQQKEDKEVKTYYVTQYTLNTIEVLKNKDFPLHGLLNDTGRPLSYGLNNDEEKALLRYLGGDETIEFKVKEPLYRLWATNENGETVYFYSWQKHISNPELAFTAPLEEIKKWQTPAWEIEEVKEK